MYNAIAVAPKTAPAAGPAATQAPAHEPMPYAPTAPNPKPAIPMPVLIAL